MRTFQGSISSARKLLCLTNIARRCSTEQFSAKNIPDDKRSYIGQILTPEMRKELIASNRKLKYARYAHNTKIKIGDNFICEDGPNLCEEVSFPEIKWYESFNTPMYSTTCGFLCGILVLTLISIYSDLKPAEEAKGSKSAK
jgi:hypothetical protein